jgi:hypothetical protein
VRDIPGQPLPPVRPILPSTALAQRRARPRIEPVRWREERAPASPVGSVSEDTRKSRDRRPHKCDRPRRVARLSRLDPSPRRGLVPGVP